MHVVVGQGQLDSVLASQPEDRRAYIEEAAGVLKHRKRKEKALRKLDAMQANLTRLTDLTGELRRQLKPLGRQAEIARRAQAIQSELRDARLRLAADDLVTLRDELAREEADESRARARRAEVEQQLSAARVEQERLEAALAQDAPRLAAAQDTWYRLSALAERLRGTVRLAQERSPAPGRARRTHPRPRPRRAGRRGRRDRRAGGRAGRGGRARRGAGWPTSPRSAPTPSAGWPRPSGRTWPRCARWPTAGPGWPPWPAGPRRCAAGRRPPPRRSSGCPRRCPRRWIGVDVAEAELATARDELGGAGRGAVLRELEERCAEAVEAHEAAGRRVAELVARERAAEQQRAHWRARVDALSVGLARRDGSAALLADGAAAGVLGPLSGLITVEPGARTALAAALGELADAVAVTSPEAAVARPAAAPRPGRRPGGPADRRPAGGAPDAPPREDRRFGAGAARSGRSRTQPAITAPGIDPRPPPRRPRAGPASW